MNRHGLNGSGKERTMIKNAIIESTMLGREDHGILTFMIFIRTNAYHCGIGGYALDSYDRDHDARIFCAQSIEAISKILDVVGVDKWEDLPGEYIRIEDVGLGANITKIGNIVEDKWFDLKEFFQRGGTK